MNKNIIVHNLIKTKNVHSDGPHNIRLLRQFKGCTITRLPTISWTTCSISTRHGATENAGVEIAGVDRTGGKCRSGKCRSKSYGTPNRDYFERILSYLNLVR